MPQNESGTIFFPIVFHAHQPVGNLPWIMEEAYKKSYYPLLETIVQYPEIKIDLHMSGPLLMWLKDNHPEYIQRVVMLEKKRQIEIIGGAFYEPILTAIPRRDQSMQIQKMNSWWRNFDINPIGIWLAERIWVPNLPSVLYDAQRTFTFIDDNLLKRIGIEEEEICYTYITEHEGKTIILVPINEAIRYITPWGNPEEVLNYLVRKCDVEHEKIVVMSSDAEKMGLWLAGNRTTHDICYKSGYNGRPWLSHLFESILEEKNNWVKPILIGDYISSHKPRGLVYLPSGSYDKMSFWSLSTTSQKKLEKLLDISRRKEIIFSEEILAHIAGSFWPNFFIKYTQSNIMHKILLYYRKEVEKIEKMLSDRFSSDMEVIWNHILAAECNDTYWHGKFGGIYYRFLRHAVYKHIISVKRLLDQLKLKNGIFSQNIVIEDILLDGHLDILLQNRNIDCFISPFKGGSIFSLFYKKKCYNFSNTLKRRIESYHLPYDKTFDDRFEKWSFQDHFYMNDTILDSLIEDHYCERGNFVNKPYSIVSKSNCRIELFRNGIIRIENDFLDCSILKIFSLINNKIIINYRIEIPLITGKYGIIFSPEINVIVPSYPYKTGLVINNNVFDLGKAISVKGHDILIQDMNEREEVSLKIKLQKDTNFKVFPLISILKNDGISREYQGTSIFPEFELEEKDFTGTIEIELENINAKS